MSRVICTCGAPMVLEANCYDDNGALSELYLCSSSECGSGVSIEVDEPLIFTDSDFVPRRDGKRQPVGQPIEIRITIGNDGVLID